MASGCHLPGVIGSAQSQVCLVSATDRRAGEGRLVPLGQSLAWTLDGRLAVKFLKITASTTTNVQTRDKRLEILRTPVDGVSA